MEISLPFGPFTEIEGTWTFVSGTGAYQNATGNGTYKFAMTSQTEFIGEWKETMKSRACYEPLRAFFVAG